MYPGFTIKAYYLLYVLKIFSLCPTGARPAFITRRKVCLGFVFVVVVVGLLYSKQHNPRRRRSMGLPLPDAPHSACAQGCPGAGTCEMGRRETPPTRGFC